MEWRTHEKLMDRKTFKYLAKNSSITVLVASSLRFAGMHEKEVVLGN